jgi:signal transduction histidine kinase
MLAYAHGADAGDGRFTLTDLLHTLATTVEPRRPVGATLRLPAADGALQLIGSVENLAGALANLCLNAFEAGADTVIVERTTAPRGRLGLAVVDNGPGIAPALRARVFEPFVSGRPGGTGLGLAVARGIVERHGGELCLADSTAGCRFELSLPARAVKPILTAQVAA